MCLTQAAGAEGQKLWHGVNIVGPEVDGYDAVSLRYHQPSSWARGEAAGVRQRPGVSSRAEAPV